LSLLLGAVEAAETLKEQPSPSSKAVIVSSSPPLSYHSIGPSEKAVGQVFDVTHETDPWGMIRLSVPEPVLKRHGMDERALQNMTLVYGGCGGWVVEEADCIRFAECGYLNPKDVQSKIPPLPCPRPHEVWLWIEPGSPPIRSATIEEVVGRLDTDSDCARYLDLKFENEGPEGPEVSLLGWKTYSSADPVPTHWRMLPQTGSAEEALPDIGHLKDIYAHRSALWNRSAGQPPDIDDLESIRALLSGDIKEGRSDRLSSDIGARLGRMTIPRSHWKDKENDPDNWEPVTAKVEKWELRLCDLVPWRKSPALFHYRAYVHEATGPLRIGTINGLSEFGVDLFARPDGRFWIIPPMDTGRMFDKFICLGSIDTNQDGEPDLLLFDWTQGESYGGVLLLLDETDIYLVMSTGGHYCP
jgi:hypothetical protein